MDASLESMSTRAAEPTGCSEAGAEHELQGLQELLGSLQKGSSMSPDLRQALEELCPGTQQHSEPG